MKLIDVMPDELVSQAVFNWFADRESDPHAAPACSISSVAVGIGMLNRERLERIMRELVDEGVLKYNQHLFRDSHRVAVFRDEFMLGDLV